MSEANQGSAYYNPSTKETELGGSQVQYQSGVMMQDLDLISKNKQKANMC